MNLDSLVFEGWEKNLPPQLGHSDPDLTKPLMGGP